MISQKSSVMIFKIVGMLCLLCYQMLQLFTNEGKTLHQPKR